MHINLVFAHVNDKDIEAFKTASRENVRASRLEPGVVRFDVIQEAADPSRYVFIEAFRDDAGPKAHKETAHYQKWRNTVAPMMREERKSLLFNDVDFLS